MGLKGGSLGLASQLPSSSSWHILRKKRPPVTISCPVSYEPDSLTGLDLMSLHFAVSGKFWNLDYQEVPRTTLTTKR